ncbi:VOC family protein [Streptomyces sp. NBC_00873]|uniref:VOC family protein n=1 Tax=unclassified Streptomyces TaxID=2593676 RepID=UPI003865514F|nr:VOC family protein [Streptomyces sp. NBC_00873]WTA47826.1 VOC family protein [Streptomyces sp. NBC_00842]
MDIKLSQCFIAVDDHDRTLAFYRDVLGLEVRNDVGFEGMRRVTVGAPSQPDVEIVLEPPLADPNASPADKEAMAELLAKGLRCHRQDRRLRRHLRAHPRRGWRGAAGADRYGVRDCAFRDPSGNMLRFSQPRRQ